MAKCFSDTSLDQCYKDVYLPPISLSIEPKNKIKSTFVFFNKKCVIRMRKKEF